jgi:hypothetical protein
MASFQEFMQQFTLDPETFDLDAFKQAALEAHNADLAALTETSNAKISTITGERDALTEKVTKLGAANYDLVQQLGTPVQGGLGAAGSGQEPKTIESLFKKE